MVDVPLGGWAILTFPTQLNDPETGQILGGRPS